MTSVPAAASDGGRQLRRRIADLGVPFGLERSCKIQKGRIFRDRFLLTLALATFGPPPHQALFDLLEEFGLPERLRGAAGQAACGAALVHFGHETGASGAVTKVYFEYRLAPGDDLVYRAFKWGASQGADETLYRLISAPGVAALRAAVAVRCAPSTAPGLCFGHLLAHPSVQGAALDTMLLDVVDQTSARASIDLNIYAAALTIAGAGDLLPTIGRCFGIDAPAMDALAAALGSRTLGHLAGGVDRKGADFITLYYGVEAR